MVNLAIAEKNLGDPLRAEALCREALSLAPGYPEGHNALGDALRLSGRIGAAEAEYQRAIALNPSLPQPRYNLGNACARQEKIAERNAAAEARAGLILALVKKDPEAARPHLLRALQIDPRLPERTEVEKALQPRRPGRPEGEEPARPPFPSPTPPRTRAAG